jgi:D-glycero-D-manno-heptose 1,7-bisphosphate phosphatase
MQKAVFLDRDGVINASIVIEGKPYPPKTLKELKILPGVESAISMLKAEGYLCIVITNQPDVSRGKVTLKSVEELNDYLLNKLQLDDIYSCYHDDNDECACRKPKPGSILEAANKYQIDLGESYMIGDRWRDIEAGQRAGCNTIFIDYNYNEKLPLGQNYTVSSLFEAVQLILGE